MIVHRDQVRNKMITRKHKRMFAFEGQARLSMSSPYSNDVTYYQWIMILYQVPTCNAIINFFTGRDKMECHFLIRNSFIYASPGSFSGFTCIAVLVFMIYAPWCLQLFEEWDDFSKVNHIFLLTGNIFSLNLPRINGLLSDFFLILWEKHLHRANILNILDKVLQLLNWPKIGQRVLRLALLQTNRLIPCFPFHLNLASHVHFAIKCSVRKTTHLV